MEIRNYLKYFLGGCCVSVIIFCLASPSFAWESETESWRNLKFSVRIFSIPEAFSLGQMSFSYNGLAGSGESSSLKSLSSLRPGAAELVSLERPIPGSPLVGQLERPRPQSLNSRIHRIGAFLLRYLNVGGPAYMDGGSEAGLSKSNRPKDQNISFEFESTPSDLSGAVLFTINI